MNDHITTDELKRCIDQAQDHIDLAYHNSLTTELEDTVKKAAEIQQSLDANVSEIRRLSGLIKRAQAAIESRQRQANFDRESLKSLRRHKVTMEDAIDRANGELQ